MIHLGIDHHKKYSNAVAMNDLGTICWDGQLDSTPEAFRSLKEALPPDEPIQCVLEAGRNWGILYDALEELGMNPKLANPLKMRLIAETFTKTDKIDATTHAIILKAGLTPLVHVPSKDVRDQKNLLRQRVWLVKLQTMLKNRIHNVIDRNHLTPPDASDMFGARCRAWMNALALRDPDGRLLGADLELLDTIKSHIRQTEKWIDEALKENSSIPILMTLPGVGKILAAPPWTSPRVPQDQAPGALSRQGPSGRKHILSGRPARDPPLPFGGEDSQTCGRGVTPFRRSLRQYGAAGINPAVDAWDGRDQQPPED